MQTKTNLKAGALTQNHNETLASGLRVKSAVKAGGLVTNHNETLAGGLRVKSAVKAGALTQNHNETLAGALPAVNPNAAIEIEDAELEIVSDALRVRTGLLAGRSFQPCI